MALPVRATVGLRSCGGSDSCGATGSPKKHMPSAVEPGAGNLHLAPSCKPTANPMCLLSWKQSSSRLESLLLPILHLRCQYFSTASNTQNGMTLLWFGFFQVPARVSGRSDGGNDAESKSSNDGKGRDSNLNHDV
jgi:hypothetical protein